MPGVGVAVTYWRAVEAVARNLTVAAVWPGDATAAAVQPEKHCAKEADWSIIFDFLFPLLQCIFRH